MSLQRNYGLCSLLLFLSLAGCALAGCALSSDPPLELHGSLARRGPPDHIRAAEAARDAAHASPFRPPTEAEVANRRIAVRANQRMRVLAPLIELSHECDRPDAPGCAKLRAMLNHPRSAALVEDIQRFVKDSWYTKSPAGQRTVRGLPAWMLRQNEEDVAFFREHPGLRG